MAALLVCSLAVPHAFDEDGVAFGAAYLFVRVMHLALYGIAARSDPTLVVVVRKLAPPMVAVATLILVAGFADGALQYVLWGLALAVEVGAALLRGVSGWRLNPAHFA